MSKTDMTPDTASVALCRDVGCKAMLLVWDDELGYTDIQHGENPEHRHTFMHPKRDCEMSLLTDVHGTTFPQWIESVHARGAIR